LFTSLAKWSGGVKQDGVGKGKRDGREGKAMYLRHRIFRNNGN